MHNENEKMIRENIMMNWHDLYYFVTLVRLQTLTATAEHIGVQHTTVARRIEQLERDNHVRLFDHVAKRYVLTVEGQLLYQQALQVEHQINSFKRMAIDQDPLKGEVILSAPPVWANQILLPVLHEFRQQFPEIILSLQGDSHFSNLHQREADIALRLKRPTQDDLIFRQVTVIQYGLFAHPNYLEQLIQNPTQTPRFIDFQTNQSLRDWYDQVVEQAKGQFSFGSNNLISVKSALLQEFGIGVLPYFLVESSDPLCLLDPHSLAKISMTELNRGDVSYSIPMYLVMHPEIGRALRVRAVADWVIKVLTEHTN